MRTCIPCIALVFAASTTGCSSIKFYSDTAREHEIAPKTYFAKPYLLVAQGDKGVSASVVTLPDLSAPVYIRMRSGYGSSNLSVGFSGGVLASIGQQADNRVPDSVTALGGLDAAMAAAAKDRNTVANTTLKSEQFNGQVSILSENLSSAKTEGAPVLSNQEQNTIDEAKNDLTGSPRDHLSVKQALDAGELARNPTGISQSLRRIATSVGTVTLKGQDDKHGLKGRLKQTQLQITRIADSIDNATTSPATDHAPPEFQLYEITMDGLKTHLTPVDIGPLLVAAGIGATTGAGTPPASGHHVATPADNQASSAPPEPATHP